jgi:hypothetical protein
MNRRILLVVAVVVCVILASAVVLVIRFQGYCGTSNLPLPTFTSTPSPTESATNLKPPTSGYIDGTKIYFVSADYSYGVYPEDLVQQYTNITVIHQGDPCLYLNLTLRNDYTDNDTFPIRWGDTHWMNNGYAYMMLDVSFYDSSGAELNTTNITHAHFPFPNRDAFGIETGGTDTLNWVFSIPNLKIDHFTLSLNYLGPLPVP